MGLPQDKNQYAQNISILRYDGKISEAIYLMRLMPNFLALAHCWLTGKA